VLMMTSNLRNSRSSVKNEVENAEEDDEDALHPAKKQKVKKDSVLHLAARSERDRQYSLLVSVEGAIDFELTMC
jgi:hypothetical protein